MQLQMLKTTLAYDSRSRLDSGTNVAHRTAEQVAPSVRSWRAALLWRRSGGGTCFGDVGGRVINAGETPAL
jgi:hypothetical protein